MITWTSRTKGKVPVCKMTHEHVLANGKEVYGMYHMDDETMPIFGYLDKNRKDITHSAFMLNVKPIQRTPHICRPPKDYNSTQRIFCECGNELEAKWKVVK